MMLLLETTVGLAAVLWTVAAQTVAPETDDFYTPPAGYESNAEGDILKIRPAPSQLFDLAYANAWQIMYKSLDSLENATYGITTVVEPEHGNPTMVVSYQQYENLAWVGCPATYEGQQDLYQDIYQQILDEGFYLSIPDHFGPSSQFGAGIQGAYSTLDSIRAVLKSEDTTSITTDAKVALLSYSAGTISSGWASELKQYYAPELSENIVGSAMGGVIPNITRVLVDASGTDYAGFVPAAIDGLAAAYPEFASLLVREFAMTNVTRSNTTQCVDWNSLTYAYEDIYSYFDGGEATYYSELAQYYLDLLTMGKDSPDVPQYIYQGEMDEFAPVDEVDKLVDSWCQMGGSVEYNIAPDLDHLGASEAGFPYALSWAAAMLSGSTAMSGCTTIYTNFDGPSNMTTTTAPGNLSTTAGPGPTSVPTSTDIVTTQISTPGAPPTTGTGTGPVTGDAARGSVSVALVIAVVAAWCLA